MFEFILLFKLLMFHKLGIILDLSFKADSVNSSIDKIQSILEICSIFITLYDSENPGTQFVLLVLTDQILGQLTHLSGDIKHHNQGIWNLIFGNKKVLNNDLGFFFSERIAPFKSSLTKYEVFFISIGNLNFIGSNFFAIFLGKEEKFFSVISLGIKSFALQILIKITGGKYITLINKEKVNLSKVLLDNFKIKGCFHTTYSLSQSVPLRRLFLKKIFLNEKKTVSVRILKFCPNCKHEAFSGRERWCQYCNSFLLSEKTHNSNHELFRKNSIFTKKCDYLFNLFGPVLYEKKLKNMSCKNRVFNFFKHKMVGKTILTRSLEQKDDIIEYNEILFTENS